MYRKRIDEHLQGLRIPVPQRLAAGRTVAVLGLSQHGKNESASR